MQSVASQLAAAAGQVPASTTDAPVADTTAGAVVEPSLTPAAIQLLQAMGARQASYQMRTVEATPSSQAPAPVTAAAGGIPSAAIVGAAALAALLFMR
jgi:hypothetical protein